MTDKDITPNPTDKPAPPTPPPASSDSTKDTQPLNQKPPLKLDPELQKRLNQMLNSRKQPNPADPPPKPVTPPVAPPPPQPEKKDPPAAPSAPSPAKDPAPVPPVKKDPDVKEEKNAAWPVPARSLGDQTLATEPAKPAAASAASGGTAQLNRPIAGTAPSEPLDGPKPTGDAEQARRSKAEAQAAKRTTGATRNVPKGRVAQEIWKVIFQAMTGAEARDLGVEVKGLSVVGRSEPDGDSKADLDLTPFNAGAYGVSRQHVILIPTDEGPCIIDMNSTNGTWINGLFLEPGRRYRLRTNDRVELGSLKLLVRVMTPAEVGAASVPNTGHIMTGTLKRTDNL